MESRQKRGSAELSKLPQKVIDHYTGRELDTTTVVHLKGIFLALDTDNDDFLTRPQLLEAVQMVGLKPTDTLFRKYMLAGNAFLNPQTIQATQEGRKKPSESMVFFKTSMETFVDVTLAELERRSAHFEEDFQYLLNVLADNPEESGGIVNEVSIKDIRHILHETLAPTRLSSKEMTDFFRACQISLPRSGKFDESAVVVDRKLLQHNIMIGNESHPIPLLSRRY